MQKWELTKLYIPTHLKEQMTENHRFLLPEWDKTFKEAKLEELAAADGNK